MANDACSTPVQSPHPARSDTLPVKPACSIDGCASPSRCHGYCNKHYRRSLKYGDPMGSRWFGQLSPAEFVRMAAAYEGTNCLHWPFARNGAGYGHYMVARQDLYAHREVCTIRHGPPPTPSHEARHKCGRGHEGCVAGSHLVWGTVIENSADRVAHGTANRGPRHGMSKLTIAQVRAIRSAKGTRSAIALAEQYGVSPSNIYLIWAGQAWAWLDKEPH